MHHGTRSGALFSCVAALLLCSSARAAGDEHWQSRTSARVAEAEYEITAQDAGWQAPNRAHGFRIWFTATGMRIVPRDPDAAAWNWGLALLRHGRADRLAPAETVELSPTGNRGERNRGGIVEWYVNDARGLEQGFTLAALPPGSGEVVLDQALSGTLHPIVSADGQAIDFQAPGGAIVLRYAGLKVTDARGWELPARMGGFSEAGIQGIRITFDDEDAVYPVTVDPLATSASWTGESNQPTAWFGYSVSTAGDVNGDGYSDVIVGAPFYDNGESEEGRAYLYLGSASGVSSTPAWTAEADQANASFGWSVSTAGDVNGDGYDDVIVGAYGYGNGEFQEGRAYVYYGSASGLPPGAAWTVESNQVLANLGYAVSTAGDVNGDGYADVIVGIPYYDNGQSDEGQVRVYFGSASGLSTTPGWSVESNQASSEFGGAVATAGDVNGDGYEDVMIGARYFDNVQFNEGRAFVYLGSASGVATVPAWTAEPDQAGAAFGTSVSTAGDVNGDGYADVIVGSPDYDNPQSGEGRASVYLGSPSGPTTSVAWWFEAEQAGARLGSAVATAGDINGDGFAEIIVGIERWDITGGSNEGRAQVFFGGEDGPFTIPDWTVSDTQLGAQFGISVATAGDVNGDGYSDVLVGANLADSGQSDEGRASVFLGSAFAALAGRSARSGNQPSASFGNSIAAAGDVDGDGYGDVIVGAPFHENGETLEGRAYLFLGSTIGIGETPTWTAEGNQAGAQFGSSVAGAGDVNGDGYSDVLVAAPGFDNEQFDQGRIFLYLGSPSGLGPTPSWTIESGQQSIEFGVVAGAGDVNGDGYADVLVGDPGTGGVGIDEGRAYLYLGSASGPATAPAWTAAASQSSNGSRFGNSVSTAGDVNRDGYADVIVGAPRFSGDQYLEGAAFVYLGSTNGLATTPSWSIEGNSAYAQLGIVVGTAGDINGDAYSDVLATSRAGDDLVHVYHGSGAGLGLIPDATLDGTFDYQIAVSTAGDINGDGYSDLIVGDPSYDDIALEQDRGRVLLHLGSASGLSTASSWSKVGEFGSFERYGWRVSTAGDVNGDGFADVLVTSRMPDFRGRVFDLVGNRSLGRARIPRQARSDGATPVDLGARSDSESGFILRTLGRTPAGRGRVRLQWEAKPVGTPFDGQGLGVSVTRDSGLPSVSGSARAFDESVAAPSGGTFYRWRVRTVGTNPYFPRSPWISRGGRNITETKLRTAGCIDRDGDGYSAPVDPLCSNPLVDCNDSSGALWGTPGTAENLAFANRTTLTWSAPSTPGGLAAALFYDTLRSLQASSFGTAACAEIDDGPNTTSTDAASPASGQAFCYLVRAQNSCTVGGVGSLGTSSAGVERSGRDCP